MARKDSFGALRLKSGKLAVGYISESENHFEVEGMFVVFTSEEADSPTPMTGVRMKLETFSPIGNRVSKMTLPKQAVEGRVEIASHISHSLELTIGAELDNQHRRAALVARPLPGGTMLQPDDVLGEIARVIDRDGKLPEGSSTHTDNMGMVAGNFGVEHTSPYRQEANDAAREADE